MSETRLREYMLKNIDDQGHFCRVEAHDSQPGIPDISYTIQGFNGWLELKYGSRKTPPKLRQMQWVWYRRNVKHGGNPLIFVGIQGNSTIRYGLIHGNKYDDIYKHHSLAPWIDAMGRYWDGQVKWAEFLYVLCDPKCLLTRR